MRNFTLEKFRTVACLVFLMGLSVLWNDTIAQKNKEESSEKAVETLKRNDPQPDRYNFRKLVNDPSSPFYNADPTIWPKDNIQDRLNYDFERLRDPKTGEIPENIRRRELEYVLSPKAHLNNDFNKTQIGVGGPSVETAAGDQSSAWINRGPYNVGGRTRALAIDIDDENIILAGSVSGGMWRSTDQGGTWTRVTASDQHPGITDVVQDPRAGFHDTWYYSTGERLGPSASGRNGSAFYQGNGIYKSTDNGLTWSLLTSTQNNTPQAFDNPFDLIFGLAINPTNGDLYVATFDGIQRSTDGGATFNEVLPADFDNFADIHITSTGILYATLDSGAGAVGTSSGIFRSTDGAVGTWVNITDGSFPASFGRTVIHSAPSNPNILYVIANGTSSAPVGHDFWKYTYVSGDGTGIGGTWEDRSGNLPAFGGSVGDFNSQGGYDLYVRVHPTDPDFVLIGGTNIYRSTDGFASSSGTWVAGYSPLNNVSLYTNHHPDQHNLIFLPSNPDRALSSHDGGMSITDDIRATNAGVEPVAWTALNNGYLTTQVYALSIGPEDQLMAGFQDNSTWFTNNTNPTDTWVDLFGGDGSYNAFNDDGTLRYLSSQNGNVFRATYPDANSSSRTSLQSIRPTGSTGALFVNPFELDPNNDNIMYFAGGTTLWRNDDLPNATNSEGWDQMTNAPVSGSVSTIGISTSPANVVYVGSTVGQIIRIDNANVGNPNGVDVSSGKGLPSGNVTSIDVNPFNSMDVVVAFSNYSIPSIFHSIDGGNTWEDVSGNLEENVDGSGAGPSIRWVAGIGNNDRFFAGTSTGLYTTTSLNGASTVWTIENLEGINNAVVEQVRTRDRDGLVVAGTHGNGLYSATYEVSEAAVVVDNPIASFEVDANSPDTQIDISTLFRSNVDPALSITVSVDGNTNTSLVTTDITNNILTLSYMTDAFGEAIISLRGVDTDGSFAVSNFTVSVNAPPINSFPYVVDFEDGLLPEEWEISGPMLWLVDNNGTPSGNTGPTGDNTQTDGSGFYIYAEATGPDQGEQAILVTRPIDLSSLNDPIMEFQYHMFGAAIGTLDLEVIDSSNGQTTNIFSVSGAQQQSQTDPYIGVFNIDLGAFTNSTIQLRFVSTRGASFTSDIALDDIKILERPANDVSITNIAISEDPFFSNSETVTVEITNSGTADQSNFPITYSADGMTPVTETFTGTVTAGNSTTFDFTQPVDISTPGAHTVFANTALPSDENTANDGITISFNTLPVVNTFPYIETFEGLDQLPTGWLATGDLVWDIDNGGTPSGGTGPLGDNTTADGSGNYIYAEATGAAEGDQGIITTGAFDLSGLSAPIMEFWYHMFGENIGALEVDIIDITNNSETTILTISGQQQESQSDPYLRASTIDLSDFGSSLIQLRFRSIRGAGFDSDVVIDDIKVFERPANDIGIVMITPKPGVVLGSSEEIEVSLVNLGLDAQNNFSLSYAIDGGSPVTEVFNNTLSSLDTIQFTFSTTADLSLVGEYNIQAYTSLAADEDLLNDTTQTTFSNLEVLDLPYAQDFEGTTPIDNWILDGVVDWIVNSSETPSDNTGPLVDHTTGTSTGSYIYAEVSETTPNDQGSFVTDPFDLSTLSNPVFEFWYHMHGVNVGSLDVYVINAITGESTNVFTLSGQQQANQGDPYTRSGLIDLAEFGSDPIQLKFNATAGDTFIGDIAIDDISIIDRVSDDVGVISIDLTGSFGDSESISVTVENFGTSDQTDFDLSYQVDDRGIVTETFTGTIGIGETSTFTFGSTSDLASLEAFSIEAYTELVGDTDRSNDTTKTDFINFQLVSDFPYVESFESGNGGWNSVGNLSSWELGTPSATIIDAASDGSEAWVTNLSGNYFNNEQSYVISPLFDLTNLTNPVISLDIWGLAEPEFDGAALQYSTDRGVSWNNVGQVGDPDNWYNEDEVDGLLFLGTLQGWDTTAGDGWVTAIHPINQVAQTQDVLLRIVFGADDGTTTEGFAFDNVRIVDLTLPDNLVTSDITATSFSVSWDAVDGISNYEAGVSTDNFSTFVPGFEEALVTTPTIEVTGLTGTSAYQTRVRSRIGTYGSDYAIIGIAPAGPTALTAAKGASGNGIVLNWVDNSGNEDEFSIERSEDGTNFMEIGTANADITTFTDETAGFGINYSYRIAARNTGGLSAYSNVAALLVTGIEDEILSQSIKISPNPSNGVYVLSMDDLDAGEVEIVIWNVAGKLILEDTFNVNGVSNTKKLDIRHEESGVYILRISLDDKRSVVRKLIMN